MSEDAHGEGFRVLTAEEMSALGGNPDNPLRNEPEPTPQEPKKWEELTTEEKLTALRDVCTDMHIRLQNAEARLAKHSRNLNILADDYNVRRQGKKIVSGAGVKVPGLRG